MSQAFDHAVDIVIDIEGGFVNDPHDRGRATKFGISLRFAAELDDDGDGRLDFDLDGDGDVDADDIKLLERPQAEKVYHRHFWDTCRCDELPGALAILVFDTAVNQGQPTSRRLLQAAIGVSVDGILGPMTMTMMLRKISRPGGRQDLLREFGARRAVHYAHCRQFDEYGLGWMRRHMKVFDLAAGFQPTL